MNLNISRNIFLIVLFFISVAALTVLSTSCGFIKIIEIEDGANLPETENYDESENVTTFELEISTEQPTEPATDKLLNINNWFDPFLKINSDVVGYIKIDNTIINFPVVFNGDNDYYLKHDIYKRENKYGAVFMDMTNHGSILDKNTMIHGHNFGDGEIFNDLEKYKNKDFFDNNGTIIFNNLYSDMEWEVFAVYVIHANDYFLQTSFSSDEEFFNFIERIKSISIFWKDYTPSVDDYILSLNTCSFEYDEAHTIIHAKLVKKVDNWQS